MRLNYIFTSLLWLAVLSLHGQVVWEHYNHSVDPEKKPEDRLCYEDTLAKYGSMYKDFDHMGNFWYYNYELTADRIHVKYSVNPATCASDTSAVYKLGGVPAPDGSLWRISSGAMDMPYVSNDSLFIQKYVDGHFQNFYRYTDKDNPILSIDLIDQEGHFWGIYGSDKTDDWDPITQRPIGYRIKRLIKHDGKQWIPYTDLDKHVCDIAKGINNDIWVVSDSLLRKYDGEAWTEYALPERLKLGIIACDGKGDLWYGSGVGESSFSMGEYKTDTIYQFNGTAWIQHITPQDYNGIMADPKGGVWVYETLKGTSFSNGGNWLHYALAQGLTDNYVYKMGIDPMGNKWFATGSGVSKLVSDSRIITDVVDETLSQLSFYPNPATEQLQVRGLQKASHVVIYSALGEEVYNGALSKDGLVWVEHLHSGLYVLKVLEGTHWHSNFFVKE